MTTTVPVNQARRHLGEIIEQAHYLGKPFMLTRGNKPMAAVIGSDVFVHILSLIETYDPGLADTLAIMSNPDVEEVLRQGDEAVQKGDLESFDEHLLE